MLMKRNLVSKAAALFSALVFTGVESNEEISWKTIQEKFNLTEPPGSFADLQLYFDADPDNRNKLIIGVKYTIFYAQYVEEYFRRSTRISEMDSHVKSCIKHNGSFILSGPLLLIHRQRKHNDIFHPQNEIEFKRWTAVRMLGPRGIGE